MKVIRKPAVIEKVGRVSGMTIDRWEKAGIFPKRVPLGPNSVGWYESEVDQWLEQRRHGAPAAA